MVKVMSHPAMPIVRVGFATLPWGWALAHAWAWSFPRRRSAPVRVISAEEMLVALPAASIMSSVVRVFGFIAVFYPARNRPKKRPRIKDIVKSFAGDQAVTTVVTRPRKEVIALRKVAEFSFMRNIDS
jgi:hypothetical protein